MNVAIERAIRSSPRRLRRAVLVIVGIVALTAGVAVAGNTLGVIPGFGDAGTHHDGFVFTTPLYAVAETTVPHFGRIRLTFRRSSIGDCHGIQLLDEPPSPARIRNRPSLAEGCGDSSSFSVATLGDRSWLLVHGRAPDETRTVLLRARGREPVQAKLIRNAGRVPYVAFLVAVPREGLCDARVSALGEGLVDVGGLDVLGPGSCGYSPERAPDPKWDRPG